MQTQLAENLWQHIKNQLQSYAQLAGSGCATRPHLVSSDKAIAIQFHTCHPAVPHVKNNPVWCTGQHCQYSSVPSFCNAWTINFSSFSASNVGRPTGPQWSCVNWFIKVVWFMQCRKAAFFTHIWLFCTSASARCVESYFLAASGPLCRLGILAVLTDMKRWHNIFRMKSI